ncbi:hypothetical protein LX32DRAFT_644571 [Colletotrichum zoysiae]|uniref:Uncharacterized protein n=1 Tax=Colletotrichum zoysiae TaxID=1216348 RepID=A0AAD9H8R8_9PEZI|nr:hypothetical protein LX32DRAFT_644571 [Colletotrichum zoysiae]
MNLIKLGLSTQETTTGGDSVLRVLFSEKGTGEDVDKVMRLLVLTGSLDEVLPSLFEGVGNHSISETARNEDATRYAISRLVWSFPGVLQIVATELQVDPLQLPPGARYASLDWRSADPDILLDQVGRGGGWDTASFRAVLRGPEKNNLGTFAEAYFFRVQALNHKLHKASNRFFATEQKIESWRKLTRRILPAVSLEALIQSSRVRWIKPDYSLSPFFRGLLSLNCDLRYLGLTDREWRRRISRAVLMWLHDVRSSGIDLDEYGAAVRKQYLENAWLHTMRWNLYGGRGTRLVALTIGSMPEDWKLHWDFDDEEFAGEFWEMVENPPLRIPGGWVDE